MKTLDGIKNLQSCEGLTVEEVKAMDKYKHLSDAEITKVIETLRIFSEIVYEIYANKKQEQKLTVVSSPKGDNNFINDNPYKLAA